MVDHERYPARFAERFTESCTAVVRRWTTPRLVGLALATALCAPGAARADPLDGATLYRQKDCVSCHGEEGRHPNLPDYPKLAGQNELYLLLQMKDIKSGARNNGSAPMMQTAMQLVSSAEMKILARYLADVTP